MIYIHLLTSRMPCVVQCGPSCGFARQITINNISHESRPSLTSGETYQRHADSLRRTSNGTFLRMRPHPSPYCQHDPNRLHPSPYCQSHPPIESSAHMTRPAAPPPRPVGRRWAGGGCGAAPVSSPVDHRVVAAVPRPPPGAVRSEPSDAAFRSLRRIRA
jgi:hypothetical protein